MWFTCDVEKANTKIPKNFVNVMPERTLEPNTDRALLARSSFVPHSVQNARTMCEINSTPMPMLWRKTKLNVISFYIIRSWTLIRTTTKLTRDTAFSVIFQKYIRPSIFINIKVTISRITTADNKSKPVSTNETEKIVISDNSNEKTASFHIVRYCS